MFKHFAFPILLLVTIFCFANAGLEDDEESGVKEGGGGGGSSALAKFGTAALATYAAFNGGMGAVNALEGASGSGGGNGAMANVQGFYHPPAVPVFAPPPGAPNMTAGHGIHNNENKSELPTKSRKNLKHSPSRKLAEQMVPDIENPAFRALVDAEEKFKLEYWANVVDETEIPQQKVEKAYAADYSEVKVPSVNDPEMVKKLKFLDNIQQYVEQKAGGTRSRAPMLVNGYMQNPNAEWNRVVTAVDGAINAGIYILVDWHNVLDSANPRSADYQNFIDQGVKFFGAISKRYQNVPNVLFELWNEPSHYVIGKDPKGQNVYRDLTWDDILRYHNAVIPAIRKNSPNAVIIAGTPGWSSGPKGPVLVKPINQPNILYTLHWYTVGDVQNNKQRAQLVQAHDKNIGSFVSEYGTTGLNANDPVDPGHQVETWWTFMNKWNVGYINWELSNQRENSAALKPSCGAGAVSNPGTCLSQSGQLVYDHLRSFNNGVICFRRNSEEEKQTNEVENEEEKTQEGHVKNVKFGRKQIERKNLDNTESEN